MSVPRFGPEVTNQGGWAAKSGAATVDYGSSAAAAYTGAATGRPAKRSVTMARLGPLTNDGRGAQTTPGTTGCPSADTDPVGAWKGWLAGACPPPVCLWSDAYAAVQLAAQFPDVVRAPNCMTLLGNSEACEEARGALGLPQLATAAQIPACDTYSQRKIDAELQRLRREMQGADYTPATVQPPGPPDEDSGIPKSYLIAGGIGAAVLLGGVGIYFATRKKR